MEEAREDANLEIEHSNLEWDNLEEKGGGGGGDGDDGDDGDDDRPKLKLIPTSATLKIEKEDVADRTLNRVPTFQMQQ